MSHYIDCYYEANKEQIEQKRKAEAFAKRSNLSKLLDGGIIEGKASKKVSGGTFKMSNFDLDEDFPALE